MLRLLGSFVVLEFLFIKLGHMTLLMRDHLYFWGHWWLLHSVFIKFGYVIRTGTAKFVKKI